MAKLRRDTIIEDDYSPQDAGWDARLEGKPLRDNPYAVNNWKHYEWEKGWMSVESNIKESPDLDV